MRYVLLILFLLGLKADAGNLFPEDTSFETGVQNFNYFRSEEQIRTVQGDAARGNSSLEVNSAINWVHGRWGYEIKKNTDYTVSFYARRISGGHTIQFAMIGVYDWIMIGKTSFQLTDRWERYSCHFRTDRDNVVLFPAFLIPGDATVFRIDAIQLEEGKTATPYQPSEVFSVYPTAGPAEIVQTPAIPRLTVNLCNSGVETDRFTLRVTLPGLVRERSFILKRGDTAKEVVELPEAAQPGYYPAVVEVLDAAGKTVKRTSAPFVVTAPFPEPAEPGFFGLEVSPMPQKLLSRIGVTRLRTRTPHWKWIEPEEGVFQSSPKSWEKPDSLFLHPTLNGLTSPGEMPPWGVREDGKKADLTKAAAFLDYTFKNLQGKAEFVDFINEPFLAFPGVKDKAEYYSELIRTAAPIARKYGLKLLVDVSGGCGFFRTVQEKAGDCFDTVSLHPYTSARIFAADGRYVASPEKGEFLSALRDQSGLAREYGKKFLIGELGYSLEETVPFNDPAAHRFASYLARMFLIAGSNPDCQYLVWFYGLDRWEAGPYLYGIWRTENGIRPLPAVAAYAQAAHEIDHATDVKWVFDDDIKVLSFRKDGRVSYAVWDATDDSEPLPLVLPEGANPRSIYGTPLTAPTVTGSPIYLSENKEGTVLPALLSAIDSRPPLLFHGYLKNKDTLKLRLYNRSFHDWKGELDIAPFHRNENLQIPRQSAETVMVKIPEPVPAKIRIEMKSQEGKTFGQTITIPAMEKVRRLKVDQWKTFDFLREPGLIEQSKRVDVFPPDPSIPWNGSDDLSHRTLLGWDEDNFYIFSEVRDDSLVNPYDDSASWQGDSLQVGIDSFNDGDGKLAYDSDDNEFTFAPEKKAWSHQGPPTREIPGEASGIRQDITRNETAKTTTYRIAIPRRLLAPLKLQAGTVFGLALCFNDEDPGENRYYMNFGGGIGNIKCPALFRKMILVE